MTLQEKWEKAHDVLVDMYRTAAREKEQGYDRESTRSEVALAERIEHEAWIAFRDAT
jgi:hypothetical protein